MNKFFLLLVLGIFFSALSDLQAAPKRVSLQEAIQQALQENADLQSQRFQEKQALTESQRIRGEFGPKIEGLAAIAPIPGAVGNTVSSSQDLRVWGRMFLANLRLTQPIYTWGRRADYLSAAEQGVQVKQAETKKKASDLRYDVKEAYYGSLYARSLMDFITDGKKDLKKNIEENGKKRSSKKESYRLEIFLKQVDEKEAEVSKSLSLAHAGLTLRAGSAVDLMPKEDWISAEERKLEPVQFYIDLSKEYRSEFQQLKDGIEAKRSLARAEKKGLLPMLGFGMNYDAAQTNVRPSLPGPFSYDPYNRFSLSVGLGLKLDFAWDVQMSKAEKLNAEAEELEAKSAYADQGIAIEVKKAYWEVEEAEKRLQAAADAYKLGKKWLSGEAIAFSAGLGKAQDLVEAYGARAETVKNYYEAIFKHHMAWASLSKVVGKELESSLQ